MDAAPTATSNSTESRLAVLIVEVEFLVRWAAAEFLRERGYIVIEATNVADAISIFGLGTKVDIVFSDIHMPGELNGHALSEWLDRNHPDVPLLLTCNSATEVGPLSLGQKRRFIAKPYELGAVAAHIESLTRTS